MRRKLNRRGVEFGGTYSIMAQRTDHRGMEISARSFLFFVGTSCRLSCDSASPPTVFVAEVYTVRGGPFVILIRREYEHSQSSNKQCALLVLWLGQQLLVGVLYC